MTVSNTMDLFSFMDELDIKKGDVLLVGSDITRLAMYAMKKKIDFDVNLFIDKCQTLVGIEGTLLFPTYNWGYCEGQSYDIRMTKSQTGSVSQTALKRDDFIRTKHPIYSFAVWGKDAEKLSKMENTGSFDSESPFEYMYTNHGKMLMLGVDYQSSFTFVHYVERKLGTDYRYAKDFTSTYTDALGQTEERTYQMLVRDLDKNVATAINPIGEQLENEGVCVFKKALGIPIRLVDLYKAFDIIKDDIVNNGGFKLHTES